MNTKKTNKKKTAPETHLVRPKAAYPLCTFLSASTIQNKSHYCLFFFFLSFIDLRKMEMNLFAEEEWIIQLFITVNKRKTIRTFAMEMV